METRTYTAKFKVGDRIVVNRTDYETFHEKPDPMGGFHGTVKRVIFPGDVLYEAWGQANGTGEVKYEVGLDKPVGNAGTDFIFSGKELELL